MIRTHIEGDVLHVVIDRSAKLNALSVSMTQAVAEAIRSAASRSAKCVLISAEGADFLAGADVGEMNRMTNDEFHQVAAGFQAVAQAYWDSDVPIVGAVRGRVIGGGFDWPSRAMCW